MQTLHNENADCEEEHLVCYLDSLATLFLKDGVAGEVACCCKGKKAVTYHLNMWMFKREHCQDYKDRASQHEDNRIYPNLSLLRCLLQSF